MNVLIWHWGRRGAGPIFASRLCDAIATFGGVTSLSLSSYAEILTQPETVGCDWAEPTYRSTAGFVKQLLAGPFLRRRTARRLRSINPDIAICAMPALLDQRMVQALRRSGIPYAVVVHDAAAHPGDGLKFRMLGQASLLKNAVALFPLTAHVETALRRQGFGKDGQLISKLWHPPLFLGAMKPAYAHDGKPRLLCFGRMQQYKGLAMLADALSALGPELPFDVRICGDGPASQDLAKLSALAGVEVDRRWIPEPELHGLFEWADAVVLPYVEASQSGVAAAAIAHGRQVLATNVGGLPEQLAGISGTIICEPNARSLTKALRNLARTGNTAMPEDTRTGWQEMAAKMLQTLEL